MRMRELTQLTGITSADLTNWRSRGMGGIPESQQGLERTFDRDNKPLVIILSVLKALALHGLPLEGARALAVAWHQKYEINPDHDALIIMNMRTLEHSVRRFDDCKSLREILNHFKDAPAADDDVFGSAGTSIAIVDAAEIAGRIEAAFAAEGDAA